MSPAALSRNHGTLDGIAGIRIHYRSWEIPEPRAALVIVHGLCDHSGRYDAFAESIAAAGCSTFALDLRGHGRSDGRRGHVRRFDIFLQELDRFRREVQGLVPPDCPIFLLGHSMGGLIALRYLQEFDGTFCGAIITSPWLGVRVPVASWKAALGRTLNRACPAFPFATGIRPDHLSRDPGIVAAYRDDPMVHRTITPRLFVECGIAVETARARKDRLRLPLLFLLAGTDHIVDTETALDFARSLPAADVTIRLFPDHYHELLNEEGRHAIWVEIGDWIHARLGRLP
ncbi:MAG TPA: alpha/beta hydrolase [Longimicrobiales bacterium]